MIFSNNAPVKYLDVYEGLPSNRYVFGCGDRNQDRVWIFRMLSINTAMPDNVSPTGYRLFRQRASSGTSKLLCVDVKALNEVSIIVAASEETSLSVFSVLLYKITIDDSSAAAHMMD